MLARLAIATRLASACTCSRVSLSRSAFRSRMSLRKAEENERRIAWHARICENAICQRVGNTRTRGKRDAHRRIGYMRSMARRNNEEEFTRYNNSIVAAD